MPPPPLHTRTIATTVLRTKGTFNITLPEVVVGAFRLPEGVTNPGTGGVSGRVAVVLASGAEEGTWAGLDLRDWAPIRDMVPAPRRGPRERAARDD